MFKLKVPRIAKEILNNCPEENLENAKRYVKLRVNFFDEIDKLRNETALVEFRKKIVFNILPEIVVASLIVVLASDMLKVRKALPILIPGLAVTVFLNKKKAMENKVLSSTRHQAYKYISEIIYNIDASKGTCSSCKYYSFESRNHGIKYPQCAVNPKLVNTAEAIDCRDFNPNS